MMGSMAGMGMHGHALRVMFAIADANDDGGLSLEEIADIQARIFGAIDADDDGTMTPEELQAFMQE
jgi:Ca2+-binding EF-hand superfamily protein